MRRILKHTLLGASLSAVAATAVVGNALGGTSTDATPPVAPPAGATAPIGDEGARFGVTSRDAARTALAVSPQREAASDKRVYARAIHNQIVSQQAAAEAERRAAIAKAEAKAAAARAKAKAAEARAKAAEVKRKAEAARQAQILRTYGYDPSTTDPRSIAKQIMQNKYGWGSDQFSCFNNIIMRESMWDIHATNAASGAYGIPQALPGAKMASAGPDWRTNAATQITWGLGYLKDRYGTPCGGWSFKSSHGWY